MDLDDEELKATRRLNGSDKNINIMGEDLKDIELFIDFCRAPYNFEHESEEKSYKELSNKIEHLIKAYKELEEENKTLNERNQYLVKYRAKLEKELYESNENYIPVSLVEEKIEEYQNNMKLYENETHNIFNENNIRQEVITVLQELLEKR